MVGRPFPPMTKTTSRLHRALIRQYDAALATNGENGGYRQESRRKKKVHEEVDDQDDVAALPSKRYRLDKKLATAEMENASLREQVAKLKEQVVQLTETNDQLSKRLLGVNENLPEQIQQTAAEVERYENRIDGMFCRFRNLIECPSLTHPVSL